MFRRTALTLSLILAAGAAFAQTGKVTVVTSFSKDVTDPIKKAFEKAVSGATLEVQNRNTNAGVKYLEETKANNQVDLFWASAPDAFEVLKAKKLLAAYKPKATGIAEKVGSYPVNDKDTAHIKEAEALFMKIRPNVAYFHSSKYISDLANGNICVAVGYSGDVLQAKARAQEAGDKVKVDYSIPKEGAGSFYDMVAIPRDAANVENAYLFMNFLMRPDIIAEITNNIGYSNANAAATPLVDEAIRDDPGSYPSQAVMATLYAIPDMPIGVQRVMTRGWTRVKLGK